MTIEFCAKAVENYSTWRGACQHKGGGKRPPGNSVSCSVYTSSMETPDTNEALRGCLRKKITRRTTGARGCYFQTSVYQVI